MYQSIVIVSKLLYTSLLIEFLPVSLRIKQGLLNSQFLPLRPVSVVLLIINPAFLFSSTILLLFSTGSLLQVEVEFFS